MLKEDWLQLIPGLQPSAAFSKDESLSDACNLDSDQLTVVLQRNLAVISSQLGRLEISLSKFPGVCGYGKVSAASGASEAVP